jgi:hypothetical protein
VNLLKNRGWLHCLQVRQNLFSDARHSFRIPFAALQRSDCMSLSALIAFGFASSRALRYEAVNAMSLNEFLKEHRQVQELRAAVVQLKSTVAQQKGLPATVAQQQNEIKGLTAGLKGQTSQIQKGSGQIEGSKAAPKMVANNR